MSEGSSSSFSLYSLLGVAGVSIIVGFGIGSYLNKSKSTKLRKDQLKKTSIESDIGSDDEVFEDTIPTEKYKMALCVRNDLKMGKGKACAQCGHATLGAYETAKDKDIRAWYNLGQAKIALRVDNKESLLALQQKATEAGLNNFLVIDAGHTQLAPETETVLAIGPAPVSQVDAVCGHLKLF